LRRQLVKAESVDQHGDARSGARRRVEGRARCKPAEDNNRPAQEPQGPQRLPGNAFAVRDSTGGAMPRDHLRIQRFQ
jgi:hypothetical protein